jgi:hypothetical protein
MKMFYINFASVTLGQNSLRLLADRPNQNSASVKKYWGYSYYKGINYQRYEFTNQLEM